VSGGIDADRRQEGLGKPGPFCWPGHGRGMGHG